MVKAQDVEDNKPQKAIISITISIAMTMQKKKKTETNIIDQFQKSTETFCPKETNILLLNDIEHIKHAHLVMLRIIQCFEDHSYHSMRSQMHSETGHGALCRQADNTNKISKDTIRLLISKFL